MKQNSNNKNANRITGELDREKIRSFFEDQVSRFASLCPVRSWEVRAGFYCFRDEDFSASPEWAFRKLTPLEGAIPAEALDRGFLSPGQEGELLYNHDLKQHTLMIRGKHPGELIETLEKMKSSLFTLAEKEGFYPLFTPKIDGLAPNGLEFILEIEKDFPLPTLNRGLRAAAALSRELAVIPCCHVNSYKRITPKKVTPLWDIPCDCRISSDRDVNALLWYDRKSTHTVVFRQADSWSEPFLVLGSYLCMLSAGFGEDHHPDKAAPPVMPNSLGVAMELWKNSAFARKHFSFVHQELYEIARNEWFEYCDIAHPWELLRG